MPLLHSILVTTHIAVGALALVLFWVPVMTRKGARTHVNVGRIYLYSMYAVSVTALIASSMVLYDPIGVQLPDAELEPARAAELSQRFRVFAVFLLMLGILVMTSLRHGMLALRERTQAGVLRTAAHRALVVALVIAAIIVGIVGVQYRQILLMIFAVVGAAAGIGMWADMRRDMRERSQRVYAHLNSLIGTGIGAYTAFFAFGGSRFLSELLPGQWQTIPWIMPAVIGTFAVSRLRRRYGT